MIFSKHFKYNFASTDKFYTHSLHILNADKYPDRNNWNANTKYFANACYE